MNIYLYEYKKDQEDDQSKESSCTVTVLQVDVGEGLLATLDGTGGHEDDGDEDDVNQTGHNKPEHTVRLQFSEHHQHYYHYSASSLCT